MRDLLSISGGDMFDVVFDATGNAQAMENGFRYIAHGGTYVLVSVVSADIKFSDPEFHKREITLMGSRNATAEDFDLVLKSIRSGNIPTADLHTHRAPMQDLPATLAQWLKPESKVIKAMVEMLIRTLGADTLVPVLEIVEIRRMRHARHVLAGHANEGAGEIGRSPAPWHSSDRMLASNNSGSQFQSAADAVREAQALVVHFRRAVRCGPPESGSGP